MSDRTVHVRPAGPGDALATAAIYNEGIRGREATVETRERTPEDVLPWLGNPFHPVLVAELDGRVVGMRGRRAVEGALSHLP
jgi:L-amino acid N-acyltransferase YncA